MANIITDPNDGRIYFTVDIFNDELLAEVTAKDDELADQNIELANLRGVAVGNANDADDGSEEEAEYLAEAAAYLSKINRNTAWRNDLGVAATVIGEITVHRAE